MSPMSEYFLRSLGIKLARPVQTGALNDKRPKTTGDLPLSIPRRYGMPYERECQVINNSAMLPGYIVHVYHQRIPLLMHHGSTNRGFMYRDSSRSLPSYWSMLLTTELPRHVQSELE